MDLLTIILFFVYIWGFGFSASYFCKNSENFWERNLMRLGIGLGTFIVIGIILNFLRISLDWKIFLALALVGPVILFFKKPAIDYKKDYLKINKENIYVFIVLVIFAVTLFMYASGSFAYPYFEDDDPWAHALGTKFVSVEKTVFTDGFDARYLDPYPPGYDLLMGILHQTSSSIMWTLKFFNSLILALGIIFFYFFAKIFTRSRQKALISTFVLASLPSFMTHFIWAHSLVIILFFPAMYCLEMIRKDKRWMYPGMLLIASILFVQPSQAMKLGVMFGLYWIVKSLYERKIAWKHLTTLVGGLLLSLFWWGSRASVYIGAGRIERKIAGGSLEAGAFEKSSLIEKLAAFLPPDSGTATKAYSFNEFFVAQSWGGINVHVGWGIAVTILLIISLIALILNYRRLPVKKNYWIGISIVWFIFTFLGVNSVTFDLPIGLIAFRFWFLLAIPVALLCSVGLFFLYQQGKKIGMPRLIILIIVILAIGATSSYQKFNHNTSPNWPPGGRWTSTEELQGYIWLKGLPDNTKVFDLSTSGEKAVIGFDKYTCAWCKETQELRSQLSTLTAKELHSWMRANHYDYLIIGGMTHKYFVEKVDQTNGSQLFNDLISDISTSNLFTPAHQNQGMIVLKVV